MKKFSDLYIIELECIDEGNLFGLKLGEVVYAAGWDGTDYATSPDNASISDDIKYVKTVAKRIYNEGNFNPNIRIVHRIIDTDNYINFNEKDSFKTFWDYIDTLKDGSDEWRIAMDLGAKYHREGKNPDNYINEIIEKVNKK